MGVEGRAANRERVCVSRAFPSNYKRIPFNIHTGTELCRTLSSRSRVSNIPPQRSLERFLVLALICVRAALLQHLGLEPLSSPGATLPKGLKGATSVDNLP